MLIFDSIADNGKTFYHRTCEPNANTKTDTCEDRTITLKVVGTKMWEHAIAQKICVTEPVKSIQASTSLAR